MRKRLLCLSLASLALLALCLGLFLWWVVTTSSRTEIVFLNVGEGDAILISQGTNQILIDGGKSGKELLSRLGRHMPFWDRQIETVIATHPDADHIGGFPSLFRAYHVADVLYSGLENTTEAFALFQESAKASAHRDLIKVFREGSLKLPAGGELTIEYPEGLLPKETSDTNASSIVIRLAYGETSFLLTGDLPHEETLLPDEEQATILKVSHHGSKYSTSEAFLDRIRPDEAIISVGKNMYGHPALETLERLEKRNIMIHRTDQEGDIVYVCRENRCNFEK